MPISLQSSARRLLLGAALLGLGSCAPSPQPATTSVRTQAASAEDHMFYTKWIRPYRGALGNWKFEDKIRPIKLCITAIEGDEHPTAPPRSGMVAWDFTSRYGCQVSTEGVVHSFYYDGMGSKGGGFPHIVAPEWKRLQVLLGALPDDGQHLPPAGRRLVVQVAQGKTCLTRVYDRANAPEKVLEILRLSQARIRIVVPEIQPTAKWKTDADYDLGRMVLSPDNRFLVFASSHDTLEYWSLRAHTKAKEAKIPDHLTLSGLQFSPTGSLAAFDSWGRVSLVAPLTWRTQRNFSPLVPHAGLWSPQFTPDNRFLLLQRYWAGDLPSARQTLPPLAIFDIHNQQRVQTVPELPASVAAYVAVPGTRRAVYLSRQGDLSLWDSRRHRDIALLDKDVRIQQVEFSPDRSRVAVATIHRSRGYWTQYRIRLWNAQSGKLLHELRPFEQNTCEAVEGLLWSPNGQYLLAATKADSFFSNRGIDIWNASSGRHRGELVGCDRDVIGLVRPSNNRVVAAGQDGVVREWDLTGALHQVARFEATLP